MAERTIRFGVADVARKVRAATWRCWTQGKDKKDVYVACREVGGTLKLSLHDSGQWHMAFDEGKFPNMFDERQAPEDRFAGKWNRPDPIGVGLTLACRIQTPWDGVTIQEKELDPQVGWIAPAPTGQSVEVAVFLSEQSLDPCSWPGRRSMSTEFVGSFELNGGGEVWVVHRCCPAVVPQALQVRPTYFRAKGATEVLAAGARAIGWVAHSDGSIILQEGPVNVAKNT